MIESIQESDVETIDTTEDQMDIREEVEYTDDWWRHVPTNLEVCTYQRPGLPVFTFNTERCFGDVDNMALKIETFARQELPMYFGSRSDIDLEIENIWSCLSVENYDSQLAQLHRVRVYYLRFMSMKSFISLLYTQGIEHRQLTDSLTFEDVKQRSSAFYSLPNVDCVNDYLSGYSVFELALINHPRNISQYCKQDVESRALLSKLLEFSHLYDKEYRKFDLKEVVQEYTTPYLCHMDIVKWLTLKFRNPYHKQNLVYLPHRRNAVDDEHTFFILQEYDPLIDNNRYWDKMSRCIEFAEELGHSIAQYCARELYTLYKNTIGGRTTTDGRYRFNTQMVLQNYSMSTQGIHLIRNLLWVVNRYEWVNTVRKIVKTNCEWYPDYKNSDGCRDFFEPLELCDDRIFMGDNEREGFERLKTIETTREKLSLYLSDHFEFSSREITRLITLLKPTENDTSEYIRSQLKTLLPITEEIQDRIDHFIL
jgi:hypothetical protein